MGYWNIIKNKKSTTLTVDKLRSLWLNCILNRTCLALASLPILLSFGVAGIRKHRNLRFFFSSAFLYNLRPVKLAFYPCSFSNSSVLSSRIPDCCIAIAAKNVIPFSTPPDPPPAAVGVNSTTFVAAWKWRFRGAGYVLLPSVIGPGFYSTHF